MAKKKKVANSGSPSKAPKVAQLVLCDALVIDPNTAKPNLFGVFDNFFPKKFPHAARFSVYVKVYDGNGHTPLSIVVQDSEGNPVEGGSMTFDDFAMNDSQRMSVGGMFNNVQFEKPGIYSVVVFAGRRKLAETLPIKVDLKGKKS